jgi:BASS family bile acid:Na+ symporter
MIFILRTIASAMAPLTLLCAIIAFVWPQSFLPFGSIFKELFAATMFALGVVLDPSDLLDTLKHPHRIGLGVLTQYIVMPTLAFVIAQLAGLPPALALGFIIVGCAPGAMASNVIVYLAGGALAFSIAMTTVATFLSPLLTPALVKLLGGEHMDISFLKLMWTIIYILVIPLTGGMLLRHYLSRSLRIPFVLAHIAIASPVLVTLVFVSTLTDIQTTICGLFLVVLPLLGSVVSVRYSERVFAWAKEVAPAIASVSIILICAYAVAENQLAISQVGGLVFVLVVLLNALGYLAGWYLARLYRFDRAHQLTLAIEIGMQNAGMGVALALAHFKDTPEVALPGALFAVWCIITAAGASTYLRRRSHRQAINLPT